MSTDARAFELHPRLAADCHRLGHLRLGLLLMMNDAAYPWFILVPQRPNVREIYELAESDQMLLVRESAALSRAAMAAFAGEKLNVAALGNVVPQLHVHHIVRHKSDPAWPSPVWGRQPPRPYQPLELEQRVAALLAELPDDFTADYRPPG